MADEQKIFDAIIRAKDESSTTIKHVGEEYDHLKVKIDHVGEGVSHVGERVEHLHGVHRVAFEGMGEHVSVLREHYGELHEHVERVTDSVFELIPAFTALGAVGSAAGVFEAVAHASESYGELAHNAAKIGASADDLNVLHVVARLTDTSVEGLDKTLTRLNRNLGEAASGKNKQLAANLASIHFNPNDYSNSTQALLGLADAFEHASAKKRTMMAMDLGGREGADLIPLLSMGKKRLAKLMAEAQKLTIKFEPYSEDFEKYNTGQKKLRESVSGFTNLLAGKLVPVLDPLIEKSEKYILANREWITDDITRGVKHFADVLQTTDWDAVGKRLDGMAKSASQLADEIGGVEHAVEALVGIMILKGAYFLATPIVQTVVLGGRVTKLAGQLTGELVGAWRAVGLAASTAAAEEMSALNAAAPVGSAVDLATGKARNVVARDAAIAAQNRQVQGRSIATALNLGVLAYTAMGGSDLDKEAVRRFPDLAEGMSRQQFDALPEHIARPVPMLGITDDAAHPGWLERVTHRDPNAEWYNPHRWLGVDGALGAGGDAALHFKPVIPAAMQALPQSLNLSPLPPLPQRQYPDMSPLPMPSSGRQAPSAPPQGGRTEVILHIPNMPQGTTVETISKGNGPDILTNLGWAWLDGV